MDADDEETMTEAEIDAEFERTQPIGYAINALAQAELIIQSGDEVPPQDQHRVDRGAEDRPWPP
ncbi:hypothetical protein SAMN04488550_0610 [Gordonia malaquae]|uniref:Uncharacterized protein n=1 Tax=Gordonia malaquae NBRC 108250 TaxID=1223542 RepID=M3UYD0_GORML|nr:hypothetical protein [Gordonia malaquae]GAC80827.1 hypothetical protein GM1_022_00380 [Gordonia malaquae NBRC 108250]SEB68254.1 hypothetical protein SAMN04488550_0610 [Gordonia malaquae]